MSDIVLGTMNPFKLDIDKSLGYDVDRFNGNLIILKIIKNRLPVDNISIGLLAKPQAGSFIELPRSKDMTEEDYKKYE